MLGPQYCNYSHALEALHLSTLDSRREKLALKLGRGLTKPQSPSITGSLPQDRTYIADPYVMGMPTLKCFVERSDTEIVLFLTLLGS